ncbi:hypothetical protein F2Q69_00049743 [Brassica cretica]|uniref:Uncharacterized protein n=1 Tax=Brassica cretica TaxID=69181 RepID=A0A8S9PP76_BRACR|nr:hypothetical protein F2Q69_00049743 [Brassica cretica]
MASHLEKASSVTFITSIAAAAFQPQVPTAIYGVTKTALLGLTKIFFIVVAGENLVVAGGMPSG